MAATVLPCTKIKQPVSNSRAWREEKIKKKECVGEKILLISE